MIFNIYFVKKYIYIHLLLLYTCIKHHILNNNLTNKYYFSLDKQSMKYVSTSLHVSSIYIVLESKSVCSPIESQIEYIFLPSLKRRLVKSIYYIN